ncbi:polyadenylate-binding 7 [Olea europaea subsp. europaea]|uniref:Polyadenylate-binding protein n=1 Tax=Olea europaea subsp. europaea TaxID=158383 RepID=A0A8S0QWT6_OLEEU|nr:polyadenylate-binding 7 [Olea europaea subsp. europaea]
MAAESMVPATPASLYVGDLQQDVTDGQLFDAFSEFKSLASVRVCRDSSTGRSLCYGYVNFISPRDALHAIEMKNHSTLNGKVIRVMWSHRDPDARRSGIGNVFVKNLSESIDGVKFQEMFQKFGNVLSCKVVTSDDGKSKGYGFVQFESENSANAAIENLNGSVVGDKKIYVGKFVKKSERAVTNPEAKYTNLYMKNLDSDVTEELLLERFSEYGKVMSVAILKDENGTSRGFGFVNFENPDNAKLALEAFHGTQLGSKVLYVARAQKKTEREEMLRRQFEEKRREKILKYKASNVYVKNIDDDVTDDELWDHFSQCGTITSAKLMRDDKGMSKGFGFVCFSMPEEAIKAVNTFHGFMLHRKPLYAAIAQRKEERQAQLQLQYAHRIAGLVGPSAVIPGVYPTLYYPSPGVVSQDPARPGLMYQPLGMRPGWRANGFADPSRPAFQTPPVPLIPNNPRPNRQNRGRMNGHVPPQGGVPTYSSHLQQPTQFMVLPKDSSKHQHARHVYVPNGRSNEMSKGSPVPIADGSEMLSSQLAAAPPDQQKQMLGERLYPLVSQHNPDLAAKITGMLLEMDNSELLLLLESPESLASKVAEAVQVLELSKAKLSSQDAIHSNYLSAQVAVN